MKHPTPLRFLTLITVSLGLGACESVPVIHEVPSSSDPYATLKVTVDNPENTYLALQVNGVYTRSSDFEMRVTPGSTVVKAASLDPEYVALVCNSSTCEDDAIGLLEVNIEEGDDDRVFVKVVENPGYQHGDDDQGHDGGDDHAGNDGGNNGGGNEPPPAQDPVDEGSCIGTKITQPTSGAISGRTGTWYSHRRAHIPLNSTRTFCATIGEPLVPDTRLSVVEFAIRNERSQNCGAAKVTVIPPDESVAPKDNGFYNSSGGVKFSNARGRNQYYYDDRAPRGTYTIQVEAVDANTPAYADCTEWEVSWRAVFEEPSEDVVEENPSLPGLDPNLAHLCRDGLLTTAQRDGWRGIDALHSNKDATYYYCAKVEDGTQARRIRAEVSDRSNRNCGRVVLTMTQENGGRVVGGGTPVNSPSTQINAQVGRGLYDYSITAPGYYFLKVETFAIPHSQACGTGVWDVGLYSVSFKDE